MANTTNSSECEDKGSPFYQLTNLVNGEAVEISMEVKGRNETLIAGDCLGVFRNSGITGCYSVPSPGIGNAGKNCNLYTPGYTSSELDNACNWNKLQFGSTTTDRVTIPLYYEDASGQPFNPFFGGGRNDEFVLRLRTPCVDALDANGLCANRQVLNELDGDDVVVQWQLTGVCGGEDCGMIPYLDINNISSGRFSGILESFINNTNIYKITNNQNILATSKQFGIETNEYLPEDIYKKLIEIEKPILTIFLNEKLISDDDKYIPNLEYQLLSVHPIADSKKSIEAHVKVNGNSFDRTIYESESTNLIDFAIQN